MNRRIFLINGASAAVGISLPGWASTTGQALNDPPIALLSPAALPQAAGIAKALAAMITASSRSVACRQFDIDGGDARSVTRALTAPACSKWLAILPPAGAVVVTELARDLRLGLRWSGRHRVDASGIRHHGSIAGLDEPLDWRTDNRNWESRLASLYFDILTGVTPTIDAGSSPRARTDQAAVELACLLLTK
jgi:hypothetical protein